MATVSPFSLGCPHKPILARQPQTQTRASFPLSAQPEGSDSTWGQPWDGGSPCSRADLGNSAPPTKLPGTTLSHSVHHNCVCLGDSDVPARWQDYPGLEGASMRVGQQAWFWLGRKAGNCPV